MKKILIVEDEDRMRKLVKDYLVKWGYEVVEAGVNLFSFFYFF